MSYRTLLALGMVVLFVSATVLPTPTVASDPIVQQVYSRGALAGDDYFDWGVLGPPNANYGTYLLPNPLPITFASGEVSAIVENPGGGVSGLKRYNQSGCGLTNWGGKFLPCQRLLVANTYPHLLDITLSSGVRAIGTQIEGSLGVDHDLLIDVYGIDDQLIKTFSVFSEYVIGQGDGTVPFVGASSELPIIKRVVYRTVHYHYSAVPTQDLFAINQLDIYRGPEPDPTLLLSSLLAEVTGVGPGNSLANKIGLAQVYFAVPDVQSTCAVMHDFVKQVNALPAKKLTLAQKQQFSLTAQVISSSIGCD